MTPRYYLFIGGPRAGKRLEMLEITTAITFPAFKHAKYKKRTIAKQDVFQFVGYADEDGIVR